MEIEAGKFYKTRDGRKAGPIRYRVKGWGPIIAVAEIDGSDHGWFSGGVYLCGDGHPLDLISEWKDEPDTPKPFCEMTDTEKGALLLARHNGQVIECSHHIGDDQDWEVTTRPTASWNNSYYRVKPEPVVREVVGPAIVVGVAMVAWYTTHDGEPVLSSIKMEKIGGGA